MKILLFGKKGQVGVELQRSLSSLGTVIALDRTSADGRGDLTNPEGLADIIRSTSPDVIVNAAAYTAVDKAESEADLAHRINAEAPALLALEAKKSGALLVHYSTDYVFDGSGSQPWAENDNTGPLNVYGKTKLEGDKAILTSGCKHLIFRTSWVYAAHGHNFPKTMLRLGQEQEELKIVNDQVGAPTGADLLAGITAQAIQAFRKEDLSGLYHLAPEGETNWYAYASYVLNIARKANVKLTVLPEKIVPIPSTALSSAARRPLNSRLDTAKLKKTFGIQLPSWQTGVTRMLAQILDKTA